ncbi:DC_STAMP domain-containing protein [Meloidogyne graminicola]|uniref:DC_STAMP domain-containing protein n=1 Tax=Meloidogyne graminicola TaxID=189291 RepID=A0A8S9ZQ99_9BILA|nr:DC_STAMP domain-containing protein [Meloidogyne graminicola]
MLFLISSLYSFYTEKKKADLAIKKFKKFVEKKKEQIKKEDAGEYFGSETKSTDSLDNEDLGYLERKIGVIVGLVVNSTIPLILWSSYFRCIFYLMLPSLIGGRLRLVLLITMVAWAFQYPVQNTTNNIENVMEGVNCITQNVKAVANEMKERAGNAMGEAVPMDKIKEILAGQSLPFDGIKKTVKKVDEALGKMMKWQKQLIDKVNNLMKNCSALAQLPFKACVGWLEEKHKDCLNDYLELLCKPINLAKGLCYATKILELHCTWPGSIKSAVKEGINETRLIQTLNISITRDQNMTDHFSFDRLKIQRALREEISTYENIINAIVFMLDCVSIIMIFFTPLMAIRYVKKFNKGESVDNSFVTKNFIEIDRARALNGLPTLLPLQPREKKDVIYPCTRHLMFKEWVLFCIYHLFLMLSVIPITCFIIVDIFVYRIFRRAFIFLGQDFTSFAVPNLYTIKVSGKGFLNDLLRTILHTFEPLTDKEQRDDLWRHCFKQPTQPSYDIFWYMFFIYITSVLLMFLQIYLRRTRHLIALHFYPERAQPRALYLYNKVLEARLKRWGMLADIQKAKFNEDVGDKEKDLLLKGMSVLAEDKQRCCRCARTDLSVENIENIRLCSGCHAIYCVDCFTIRKRCFKKGCNYQLMQIITDVDLYVDSSLDGEEEESEEEEEEKFEITETEVEMEEGEDDEEVKEEEGEKGSKEEKGEKKESEEKKKEEMKKNEEKVNKEEKKSEEEKTSEEKTGEEEKVKVTVEE